MTRALRHEWHSLLYAPGSGFGVWAKLVGCALVEHANTAGVCWPSLPKIAAYASCASSHTVIKGIEELEAGGLLQVERRTGRVNRYTLVLPALTRASGARVPVADPCTETPEPVHDPCTKTPEPVHAGAREPIEPSEPVEPVHAARAPANVQTLVAYYIDKARELGADPPRQLIGQVARQLTGLAGEGYDDATLRAALAILLDRRLHPATLPSLIIEAQAGPATPRRREHDVDRRFRETYGYPASELNHVQVDRPGKPAVRLRALPPGGEAS